VGGKCSMFRSIKNKKQAQTLLEYSIVLSVIGIVIFGMAPAMRRTLMSMIKTVSDRVGNQLESDQLFDNSGHLIYSRSRIDSDRDTLTEDFLGNITYTYDDIVEVSIESLANLGFTKEPEDTR